MKWMLIAVGVIAVGAMTGCSSLKSTYVGGADKGDDFDGMPIVVQRPKYLKVTHKEVTYAVYGMRTSEAEGAPSVAEWVMLGPERTVEEVEIETVSVGEVYAVDFKRPAAGTADYTIEFDPGTQYPKKLGAKIDDKTITEIGNTVGNLLQKTVEAFKLASSGQAGQTEVRRVAERITRIELRSLDTPDQTTTIYP